MSPNGGKPFEQPWQAQAFAIVVRLNAGGHFGWDEWVRVLSEEIARSPALPGETSDQTYYRQWVAALERMLVTHDVLADGDAEERAAIWRQAYLNTPHGQPIALGNATCPPAHSHEKPRGRTPIAVSAAAVEDALT
jgi:nitrile hydratase accessory protein